MPRPSGRDRLLRAQLLLPVRQPGGDHGGGRGAGDELPAVRACAEEGGAGRGEEDAGLLFVKGEEEGKSFSSFSSSESGVLFSVLSLFSPFVSCVNLKKKRVLLFAGNGKKEKK